MFAEMIINTHYFKICNYFKICKFVLYESNSTAYSCHKSITVSRGMLKFLKKTEKEKNISNFFKLTNEDKFPLKNILQSIQEDISCSHCFIFLNEFVTELGAWTISN